MSQYYCLLITFEHLTILLWSTIADFSEFQLSLVVEGYIKIMLTNGQRG